VRRLAAVAAVLLLAGCRAETVTVSFRPEVGATYRYEIEVTAETITRLEGSPLSRRTEQVQLVEDQTVLQRDADGVEVHVVVGEPGTAGQAFVVRLGRAAQLESITSTEGATPDVVGALGVNEIVPGTAGAPPGRALSPGERWRSSRWVQVPGAEGRTRLRTTGRLTELGLDGDIEVARFRSTTTLQLRATVGSLELRGRQRIDQQAVYDLADGAVRRVTATTEGRFAIRALPPPGTDAQPVPGTLVVRVTSRTRRLAPLDV
jgi:hypothetical protein